MKVLKNYQKKLRFKNYSERTIETYVCYLDKFLKEENTKDPHQVTTNQIVSYLENKTYSSSSQQNQIIGSLKLFAKCILGKKEIHLSKIERPRKEKKLPRIIDAEILAEKIKFIPNLKHKSILALGLSCGLRISEVVNLKWEHLDRKEGILKVVNGKGKKDRNVDLNENMIRLLTEYWKEFKSKEYVFNGQFRNQYSTSSIQNIVKKYIHPKASFHLLRHSFGTFAIDSGVPLPILSDAMGHESGKTTETYIHLSKKSIKQMKQAI